MEALRRLLAQDAQRQAPRASAACPRRPRAPRRSRTGEVDIAYLFTGPIAEDIRAHPGTQAHRAAFSQRRRSGSTCRSSGIRSRPGTTGACGWPRATPIDRTGPQPGGDARAVACRPATSFRACPRVREGVRAAGATTRPRRQAAARRGRLPQRLRRRRRSPRVRRTSRWARRSAAYLQAVGIKTHTPDDGARRA